jgi:hypothetical protein
MDAKASSILRRTQTRRAEMTYQKRRLTKVPPKTNLDEATRRRVRRIVESLHTKRQAREARKAA